MKVARRLAKIMGATALFCLAASGVRADVIDGDWCAPDGRSFTIDGPNITTPGGAAITGDYTRHSFVYVVPQGENGSGTRVAMQLLNEETVHLTGLLPEIWRRCSLNS
jgi:hypothetical protein